MIEPQAEVQRRVAGLDVVLNVCRLLLDRERLVVGERGAAVGQVEGRERRVEVAVLARERRIGRIGDAERELLVQPRRADRAAEFHVVVRRASSRRPLCPDVRQPAILTDRRWRVVERIGAGQCRSDGLDERSHSP